MINHESQTAKAGAGTHARDESAAGVRAVEGTDRPECEAEKASVEAPVDRVARIDVNTGDGYWLTGFTGTLEECEAEFRRRQESRAPREACRLFDEDGRQVGLLDARPDTKPTVSKTCNPETEGNRDV